MATLRAARNRRKRAVSAGNGAQRLDPRIGNQNALKRVRDLSPGPWQNSSWRRKSRPAQYVDFIERYCRSQRGNAELFGPGRTLRLIGWQKDWIEEVFADGVNAAGLSIPRGAGKSTMLAAIGVAGLFLPNQAGAPTVAIVAFTINQAKRACFSQALSMILHEPSLNDRATISYGTGAEKIVVPSSEGLLEPISKDIGGLVGADVTLAICDEWAEWAPNVYYTVLSSRKREGALVIGAGSPGFVEDSALNAIRARLESGEDLPGYLYREFSGEPGADIHDEANWYSCNPSLSAGFPTLAHLRSNAGLLSEAEFRVRHLGEHGVINPDCWLDSAADWDSLADPYEFVPDEPTWIGLDVGFRRDATGLLGVQRRPDGRYHAKVLHIWTPAAGHSHDPSITAQAIRDACSDFTVKQASYDPHGFRIYDQDLLDEGVPMVKVEQASRGVMPAVIAITYNLIRTGQLSHDGDRTLRAHVLGAKRHTTSAGWTLEKAEPENFIDGCIAMALALAAAAPPAKKKREPAYVEMISFDRGLPPVGR
jgi:phage terminase large subunit-like protein